VSTRWLRTELAAPSRFSDSNAGDLAHVLLLVTHDVRFRLFGPEHSPRTSGPDMTLACPVLPHECWRRVAPAVSRESNDDQVVTTVTLRKEPGREHRIILVDRAERHVFAPSLLWLPNGKWNCPSASAETPVKPCTATGVTVLVVVPDEPAYTVSKNRDDDDALSDGTTNAICRRPGSAPCESSIGSAVTSS